MAYAYTLRYNNQMKPLKKINTSWSTDFAYIIGLIATDGSLSKDGRHIIFTSKDKQLIGYFKKILLINNKIGLKNSGSNKNKIYYYTQIGDINFYNFLEKIGIK
ncbi:MAG: LAGLIDADG family homing endonuclease, partial [Patescibacteria group bacterium]